VSEPTYAVTLTEAELAVILAALMFLASFAPGQPQTAAMEVYARLVGVQMAGGSR